MKLLFSCNTGVYAKGGMMDKGENYEKTTYFVVDEAGERAAYFDNMRSAQNWISNRPYAGDNTDYEIEVDVKKRTMYAKGGMMAKGGQTTQKPLSYYEYETANVRILWKGIVQPYGFFKSAEDAYKLIKKLHSDAKAYGSHDKISLYEIYTPDKTIKLTDDGKIAKGGKN